MTKKRQPSPRPVTITPATAASQYHRERTRDELWDLLKDLMPYAGDMPAELWDRVRCLVMGLIVKAGVSMEEVHKMRWLAVREAIERGENSDTRSVAAADDLAGSPAAGGPDAMEASFLLVDNLLPPAEQRRKQRRNRR